MQKTIKLNSGYDMPTIGLGTYKSQPNEVGDAVRYALTVVNYKHIDGAMIYNNEPEIGRVYGEVFKKIKREEIFITSKLWNTDHASQDVETACRKTLTDLRLDYLDLYLMHWGVAFPHGGDLQPVVDGQVLTEKISVRETWEAMENLVKIGLVKSIGVANFTAPMLIDLLTYSKIIPATNQIEIHPYNTQVELVEYCKRASIVITAYSPLGRYNAVGVNGPRLLEDPLLVGLAKKYSRTPAQIALYWGISRGFSVIPKSVQPTRILENINIYDFEMSADDLHSIDLLNRNYRYIIPSSWGIPYFN